MFIRGASFVRLFGVTKALTRLVISQPKWNLKVRNYSTKKDLPRGNDNKKQSRFPVTWLSLGIFLLSGGALTYSFRKAKRAKIEELTYAPPVGKAKIGGPFTLVDVNNKPYSSDNLKGKFFIMYFGFTHCPDICPDELYKLTDVMNTLIPKLKKEGIEHELTPIFISVDPKRDSPEVVKAYLEEFHPQLIGLTGTIAQIADVAHKYRVYFNANQMMEESDSGNVSSQDYIVDHSIIMYLIDPQGYFVHYYGQNTTAPQMASDVLKRIKYWKAYEEPESEHANSNLAQMTEK